MQLACYTEEARSLITTHGIEAVSWNQKISLAKAAALDNPLHAEFNTRGVITADKEVFFWLSSHHAHLELS